MSTDVEQPGWKLIASRDDSEPYSIDVIEIYRAPDGYFVRTASGCSCWDGEYDEHEFKTLELLALWLFQSETQWQPNLRESVELLKEVFSNDS